MLLYHLMQIGEVRSKALPMNGSIAVKFSLSSIRLSLFVDVTVDAIYDK